MVEDRDESLLAALYLKLSVQGILPVVFSQGVPPISESGPCVARDLALNRFDTDRATNTAGAFANLVQQAPDALAQIGQGFGSMSRIDLWRRSCRRISLCPRPGGRARRSGPGVGQFDTQAGFAGLSLAHKRCPRGLFSGARPWHGSCSKGERSLRPVRS